MMVQIKSSRSEVLISVDSLLEKMSSSEKVTLLDVSDDLEAKPLDRDLIPGAIAISLAADISGPASKEGGKRPLPSPSVLEQTIRQWGIDSDSLVIAYDATSGAQASRAWWTFRWAGHEKVRLLNGGFNAWKSGGYATTKKSSICTQNGNFIISPGRMPTIGAEEAQKIARTGTLLDARGKSAFEGEAGKSDTGHIPGAISAPAAAALNAEGYFKTNEELVTHFSELGAKDTDQLAVYCGSGNAAAHDLAAMYAAGINGALYVGSWSAWVGDPDRPVAQGPEPG